MRLLGRVDGQAGAPVSTRLFSDSAHVGLGSKSEQSGKVASRPLPAIGAFPYLCRKQTESDVQARWPSSALGAKGDA